MYRDEFEYKLKGSVSIYKKTKDSEWSPVFTDHNLVVNHSAWIMCHLLRGSVGTADDSTISSANFNIRKIWLGNHTNPVGFSYSPEFLFHTDNDNTTLSWSRALPISSVAKSGLGYEGVTICDVVRDENNEITLAETAMDNKDEVSRELALRFTMIIDYTETTGFSGNETYNVIALSTNEASNAGLKTPHVFAIRNLGDRVISKTSDEAVKIVWAIIFSEALEEEPS